MLPENGGENDTGASSIRSASRSPQPPVENNKPKVNGSINPLEKIEQLLTCSICLDRYKMPKLLPCHHTFCLPCLESYADTVHHNLKCPECRSEHAVPFEGAKAFPNNLTLAKFLDIHLEATDDNQEQLEAYIQRYNMERCKICDEKAEVEVCAHCDRKACKDCRNAHMEMVKRDLSRLLNQVKRLSNRIKEANTCVKKGILCLNENVETTRNEVKDYFQRYQNELKRREEHFLNEVLLYEENETRLMKTLGERLDAEESNLTDACSWVETVLGGDLEAKEDELCKFKQSFADGIEYLRNFQPDSDELFSKKIRFSPGDDASKLPQAICNFGELTVYMPQFAGRYLPMEQQYLPRPLRMGMESDSYRTSLRTREEERQSKYGKDEKSSSSKAYRRRHTHGDDEWAAIRADRIRRGVDSGRSSPNHTPSPFTKSPFLSPAQVTEQCEAAASRSPELLNVEDTRPASVSPTITPPSTRRVRRAVRDRSSFLVDEVLLSSNRGFSPREAFMQAVEKQTTPTVTLNDGSNDINSSKPPLPRQSESKEDDSLNAKVEKIVEAAHQRQTAASSSSVVTNEERKENISTSTVYTPVQRRQKFKIICRSSSQNPARRSLDLSQMGDQENGRDSGETNGVVLIVGGGDGKEDEKPPAPRRRSIVGLSLPAPGQKYIPVSMVARPIRPSNSTDVEDNIDETESPRPPPRPHSSTGFADEMKNATVIPISFFPGEANNAFNEPMPTTRPRRLFGTSATDGANNDNEGAKTRVYGEESNTEGAPGIPSRWMLRRREKMLRSRTNPDVFGSLDPTERRRLISEANSRLNSGPSDPSQPESPVASPSYRRQRFFVDDNEENMLPSTSASSSRRRHDSVSRRVQELLNDKELKELLADSTKTSPSITSPTTKNTFFSKDPDAPVTPIERRSRFTRRTSSTRLSLEATPFIEYSSMAKPKVVFGQKGDKAGELNWPRGIATLGGGVFAVADSSNHRIQIFDEDGILKRKFGTYGALEGQLDSCAAVAYNRISKHLVVSDRYNHRIQLFDLDGRYVRMFGGPGKENGAFNNPWGVAIDNLGMIYVCDKDNHRVQVFDKNGTFMQKFGSKGDAIGQFNHPLFIAIHSKTQNLFVSDSANHRICVLDHNGGPILTFGTEGFSVGQLKLPRGLVIDEQGFVVVADSGNNRIQVFSPDGKFVHGFGVWGTGPGQFKGIEGVALLERRIVVSDRENHRIQIF